MALWNRSSYLMIARLMPIVLILTAGFFWKNEKRIRLQTEKRLRTVSDQLTQSREDLEAAQREAREAGEEKRFLIQQLGQRDEHIRRLLAEMIKLLSGSGSVDLGEVLVRTQEPGAWDGVHKELSSIVSAGPIGTVPAIPAPMPASGLRQVAVESLPAPMPVIASAGPSPAHLFNALSPMTSQILTLNVEHRFIVISQGSQEGLNKDDQFDVFIGDQKVGRIQITTVYDRISTASILDGEPRSFREGGSVRLDPASR